MGDLHAHMNSSVADCDGRIDRGWVVVMTDEQKSGEFGTYEFRERVIGGMVSRTDGGTLTVAPERRNPNCTWQRMEWYAETEEGWHHTTALFCDDECDPSETLYRDHTAESMGY